MFEEGFAEEDLLWKPLRAETPTDEDVRSRTVLDEVFRADDSTYVSVTSHSGEIASLLRGEFLRYLFSIFATREMESFFLAVLQDGRDSC